MGETISFMSNGDAAGGYLAVPASGSGPGVLVLQEWWGLAPWILSVADHLADDGFVALVPDLYHGEIAGHDEMDKAAHLMNALPADRAARDMGGAVDSLLANDKVNSATVGAIGFCMGGMLSLLVAAQQGPKIGAVVPFYGAPLGDDAPDLRGISAPIHGHFAEFDDFFPPDAVTALGERLRAQGKDCTFEIHAGTGHAFANSDNPLGTFNLEAAATTWDAATQFLHKYLG